MINLTPSSSPSDVNGVVEIISLLSDAAAYKKRLAELQGVADAADRRLTEAKALEEKYEQATKMLAEATAILAKHNHREGELASRAGELDSREAATAQLEKDHKAKHAKADQELAGRHQAVAALEKAAAEKHSKLTKREAEVDAKAAAVDKIVAAEKQKAAAKVETWKGM